MNSFARAPYFLRTKNLKIGKATLVYLRRPVGLLNSAIAAIDQMRGAGHERSLFRTHPNDRFRNFTRKTKTPHRYLRHDLVKACFHRFLGHRRLDVAGVDAVYPYAIAGI